MYDGLAKHYDQIYGSKSYAAEAEAIRDLILSRRPNAESLLDVACGTGGHLKYFNEWFRCEGLDLSPEMIGIASTKLQAMPLHVADMTDFSLGRRFDAVVCLYSSVGHLATVGRLKAAISNMAMHLNASGSAHR